MTKESARSAEREGGSEMANLEHPPEAKLSGDVSHALRVAAIVLRTLFIVLLLVLTFRVSLPQSETIWTAYDTPADLVRLILGVGVPIGSEKSSWMSSRSRLLRNIGSMRS
jgi:hypothetical protein